MLTLTYFTARSNLVPYAYILGKGKTMDFSETFVYDLKLATDDIKTLSPGHYMPAALGLYMQPNTASHDSVILNPSDIINN